MEIIIGIVSFTIIVGIVYLYYINRKVKKVIFWEEDNTKVKNVYYINYKKQKIGVEKFYYLNGNIHKERNWIKDKLEGQEVIFYDTGEKYIERTYKNNELDGLEISYFLDGNISVERNYKEGKQEGQEVIFSETGENYVERIYKNGELDGLERVYLLNGNMGQNININKERSWKEGKLEGVEIIFYDTGERYIEKKYKNNLLDGDYIVFSPKGEVLEKYIYQEGNLISSEEFYVQSHFNKLHFSSERLVSTDELLRLSRIEKEYERVKSEEDTKDEEKEKENGFFKMVKVAVGVQGYRDRKSAIRITEICDELYDKVEDITEACRKKLEHKVSDFGNRRLVSLQNTTGRFLKMLEDMGQNNNVKEYAISSGVGFSIDSLERMERIDMEVSKALKSTMIVGGLGTAAAMGTPALVTGTVGMLATASTGTAISSLSGVAATNATLAWLGGGSLAAGGGGMAAGAALLGTIQAAATGGVALLAAGLLASTHYSKKLTEAKEKQKAVETEVEKHKLMWELLEGINKRTDELDVVTTELEKRITEQQSFLSPLTLDFNTDDPYYSKVFQRNGALIISMNELAQTPLLNKEGDLSSESANIVESNKKVLNTEL